MYPDPTSPQTLATLGADMPGTIYAGGQATQLPNKQAFYNAISQNQGNVGADQFYNNPWGVSSTEINAMYNTAPAKTTTTTTTPDPYQAQQNLLKQQTQNNISSQLGQLPGVESNTVSNLGLGLGSSIQDLIAGLDKGQKNVNLKAQQNELSRLTGTRGVQDMVSHGLQSGGVQLANRNASDSSAAEALARAYNILGRQGLTKVGNQYAMGQSGVQQAQNDLDLQRSEGIRHTNEQKQSIINQVVTDAQTRINGINQLAAIYGLNPTDVTSHTDAVRQNALDLLAQYDQTLGGVNNIKPASLDQNRAAAEQMSLAGTAPENAFNLGTAPNAQFQNTGPFASDIPLFTFPGSRKQTA